MAEEKLSPEELLSRAEEAKQKLEKRKKQLEAVKIALNSAPQDENVRIVLRYLKELAGFDLSPAVVGNNFEIQVSSTIHNVGRLGVYHDMRKLMSAETKNVVERSE